MQLQFINSYWLRFLKCLVCSCIFILIGCSASHSPPPHTPVASDDYSLEPLYTDYTNEISCKQVSQLLIMETGRDNIGLMIGAFITGVNYQKKRVSEATISQLLASVNWYCKNHPKASVTKAMIALDRDIDEGFASKSSTEVQTEPAKQSYRKQTIKTTPKAVAVTDQSGEQKTITKPAAKRTALVKATAPAKQTVTRKTVVIPRSDPAGTHVVQIMSSQDESEAKVLAEKLKTKGFPTFVTTVDLGSNGTWHRVLIGPYKDNTSAKRVADLLEKFNYKTFVRLRR